jgi:hypothetical protein
MIDIFIIIVAIVIVYYIKQLYQLYTLRQQLAKSDEVIKDIVGKTMLIKVDDVDGKLFAYDVFDNLFVAQGNNLEELGENFAQRYPTKVGLIIKDVDYDISREEQQLGNI